MNYIIVSISLVVFFLFFSTYFIAGFNKNLFNLNLLSLTCYSLLIMSGIGSVLIAISIDRHYMAKYLTHEISRIVGWSWIMYTLFIFALILFLFYFFPLNKKDVYSLYYCKSIQNIKGNRITKVIFTSILFICLCCTVYVIISIGLKNIPILNLIFKFSDTDLNLMRNQVSRFFKGNVYVRNIVVFLITPILPYMSVNYYLLTKDKFWKYFTIVSFIISVLILTYDLQKAPILFFLVGAYVNLNYLGKKISLKKGITFFIILVVLVIAMYLIVTDLSLDEMLTWKSGPVNRIVLTQSMTTFLHFDTFNYIHQKIPGAGINQSLQKLIFKTVYPDRSGRILMKIHRSKSVNSGVAGVMNSLFIGEAYAEFGYLGVIFSVIFVAFLGILIIYVFSKLRRTPISIALFAVITMKYVISLHGGFIDYIYNPGLWITFLFFYLLDSILYRIEN